MRALSPKLYPTLPNFNLKPTITKKKNNNEHRAMCCRRLN